jgi:murein DD-endopeptidase MepM/ murein hydrolase activator NlpD
MKRAGKGMLAFFFLLCGISLLLRELPARSRASRLSLEVLTSEAFREQDLPVELYEDLTAEGIPEDFGRLLAVTMLDGKFHPRELSLDGSLYERYKPREFEILAAAYEAIWTDLKCFPVPREEASFEDGWMEGRSYGGDRQHEGCDIFGAYEEAGMDLVLSMTDGTVEKIGWLPLGGYRIGIRAPSGGYFYYAHLDSYARDFAPGDEIRAGDLLGYMGNTGYGDPGTRGKFPVHLHVGIYIVGTEGEEIGVNPYWPLIALQNNKFIYKY